MCKYHFEILLSIFLDMYPEVELLDPTAILVLIFLRKLHTVFQSVCSIFMLPAAVHKGSNFSTSSPTLVIFSFFDGRHSVGSDVNLATLFEP